MLTNKAAWMQMWGPGGKAIAFNPLDPKPDMIHIETIAHTLANQCRFAGSCHEFFSVAQHSVIVSSHCDEKDALWGLLHDASEAYIVDIPRPLKNSKEFEAYYTFERMVMGVICEKWDLNPVMPESVRLADEIGLAWEARDNLQPIIPEIWSDLPPLRNFSKLAPLAPRDAEQFFLNAYHRILRKRELEEFRVPPR